MLTRRQFTAALVASPLLAQPRRPNIVFIIADDLGFGDLSCYGQDRVATPNIDRLAKEGMRFTQAYAGATVCAPSRCSLMRDPMRVDCAFPNTIEHLSPNLDGQPDFTVWAERHSQRFTT